MARTDMVITEDALNRVDQHWAIKAIGDNGLARALEVAKVRTMRSAVGHQMVIALTRLLRTANWWSALPWPTRWLQSRGGCASASCGEKSVFNCDCRHRQELSENMPCEGLCRYQRVQKIGYFMFSICRRLLIAETVDRP
jgi:hypothetical protein